MPDEQKEHKIEYTVDGEEQFTTKKELTPRQILTDAGIDPANYYLVQLEGEHEISYKDKMDELIHMHEKMKFVSIFTGETPVS